MDYTETGDGPVTILLVPGGPSLPPSFYHELTTRLSSRSRVITYVPRGTTPRPPDEFPRTTADAAVELHEVVTAVAAGGQDTNTPLVLLGHSYGSAVVLEYLVHHGGGGGAGGDDNGSATDTPVAAAILISPYSSGTMIRDGISSRVAELPAAFHERYNGGDVAPEELDVLLDTYWFHTHFSRLNPWPDSFLQAIGQLNPEFIQHYIGTNLLNPSGVLLEWNRDEDLTRINVPTLIVSGRYDYFNRTDLERMRDRIPQSDLVIGEEAAHSIWVDEPDAFYPAVERFLSSVESGSM